MDSDVTLGDYHKRAPPAGVLDVIVGCRHDMDFSKRVHFQNSSKLVEGLRYKLLVIQALGIAVVAVNSYMLAKVNNHIADYSTTNCGRPRGLCMSLRATRSGKIRRIRLSPAVRNAKESPRRAPETKRRQGALPLRYPR